MPPRWPLVQRRDEEGCGDRSFLWLILALSAGLLAGGAAGPGADPGRPQTPLTLASRCVGWMYFFCWSVSFWPQIFSNWRARSTVGLSVDFLILNWIGFLCYAIFNTALFCVPSVQEEFRHRNDSPVPVHTNDV